MAHGGGHLHAGGQRGRVERPVLGQGVVVQGQALDVLEDEMREAVVREHTVAASDATTMAGHRDQAPRAIPPYAPSMPLDAVSDCTWVHPIPTLACTGYWKRSAEDRRADCPQHLLPGGQSHRGDPSDAISVFLAMGLDHLILEDRVIGRASGPPQHVPRKVASGPSQRYPHHPQRSPSPSSLQGQIPMIDLGYVRANPEEIKSLCRLRDCDVDVDRLLDVP